MTNAIWTAAIVFGALSVSVASSAEMAPKLQLKSTGGITKSIDGEKVMIDFKEPVSVIDLIKPMAEASGKNVVLDKNAGDVKVAVAFERPLPKAEAFAAIVKALEEQGLKVDDDGENVRVVR